MACPPGVCPPILDAQGLLFNRALSLPWRTDLSFYLAGTCGADKRQRVLRASGPTASYLTPKLALQDEAKAPTPLGSAGRSQ